VTDLIGEISSASDEQSRGISQVGQAVSEMDGVTQQNAALVQESAAAAGSLEEQARRLTETVAIFQLPDVGKEAASRRSSKVKPTKDVMPVAVRTPSKETQQGNWETF
jgi:methyl-accepting chemotaxis protein